MKVRQEIIFWLKTFAAQTMTQFIEELSLAVKCLTSNCTSLSVNSACEMFEHYVTRIPPDIPGVLLHILLSSHAISGIYRTKEIVAGKRRGISP